MTLLNKYMIIALDNAPSPPNQNDNVKKKNMIEMTVVLTHTQ